MMKSWKKQASMVLGSVLLGTSLLVMPAGRADAVDAWAVAAHSLGVLAAYKSSLSSILALGNDVHAQVASARQDRQENGLDDNEHDVQVVNRVMQQLVTQGKYVL